MKFLIWTAQKTTFQHLNTSTVRGVGGRLIFVKGRSCWEAAVPWQTDWAGDTGQGAVIIQDCLLGPRYKLVSSTSVWPARLLMRYAAGFSLLVDTHSV